MIIDYSVQKTFNQNLVIDDIGRCAIVGHGSYRTGGKGPAVEADYYMLISTLMGRTTLMKWGPMEPGYDGLVDGFSLSVKQINYKETAVLREIQQFLNAFDKAITDAELIPEQDAISALPTMESYANTLS